MSRFSEYFTYIKAKYIKIGSVQINEISTDGTMTGNSDLCVPTEKAVKTYVDQNAPQVSAHTLTGANHTATGLSTGHFLKATGATTFGFAAHGLTASDVGAIASTLGAATGDMVYYSGSAWVKLAAGASGEVLTVQADGTLDWQAP